MIQAVIFDLDDTLIDWSDSLQKWPDYTPKHYRKVFDFVQARYPQIDFDVFESKLLSLREKIWSESIDTLKAPNVGDLFVQVFSDLGVPPLILNQDELIQAYDWHPVEGVKVFPDAFEVLSIFLENNIRTAIVTNASETMSMRDVELRAFGLLKYFPECRISSADVGYMKPHPLIFETLLSRLCLRSDEIVFIGDNLGTDILGAKHMKIRTIWRRNGRDISSIPKHMAPDAIIETLHDVIELLNIWSPGWRKV